ncbi:hypothetical protein L1987_30039 [Smallanthus sonchifolius]|uniref:Uncharacterized protein n=1 Tax=Smallanthus sonchifolius TaxID=185202 RepID=A0ACB9I1J8_9ASTR|nr:hypothetical protein L1987_30039 [Smallanthus sonchifolius]
MFKPLLLSFHLPDELTDENFPLVANSIEPENFCFMALESIVEGVESEEVVSESENVTNEMIKTDVSEEKVEKEVMNLSDPWNSDDVECKCECALMAAAKRASTCLDSLWDCSGWETQV